MYLICHWLRMNKVIIFAIFFVNRIKSWHLYVHLHLVNQIGHTLMMTNDSYCVCFRLEYLDYSVLHSNISICYFLFYGINRLTDIEKLWKKSLQKILIKMNLYFVCFAQRKTDVGFLCYYTCSTETTIRTHCVQLPLELLVRSCGYSFVKLLPLRFTLRNPDCWHFFYMTLTAEASMGLSALYCIFSNIV